MRYRFATAAALAAAVLTACAEHPTAPVSSPSFSVSAPGNAATYVVQGTANTLPSDLEAQVTAAGGSMVASMSGIGVAVATSSDPAFASRLSAGQGIQSVDQDTAIQFQQPHVAGAIEADAAGDPTAQAGVGAVETFRALQWAPDAINAPAAWNAGYQGQGARVAIVDGGIWSNHIDIAPELDVAHSRSFVPGQPFNNDAAVGSNGVCGSAFDTFWHATHVGGIVAAPANNLGTVGIAPRATLIGVKVLHCGTGSFNQVIQGIYYAATPIAEGGAGADIINMSLGALINGRGTGIAHLLDALSKATSYARRRGVLVVVAAGNDAADLDHTRNLISVPAQSVGVTAVSALGPEGWALGANNVDRPASYTNFGQSAISFGAPGGDFVLPGSQVCSKPRFPSGTLFQFCWVLDMVMAPCRGSPASISSYCWAAGTSMAAPHVSGVAALIIGKYGRMQPAQIEAILRQTSDDLGKPGNDDFYGQGRINAGRAVGL